MTLWPWWTYKHSERLLALCREDGLGLSDSEILTVAEGYMDHGSDGGGNQWGIAGTVVALNVDRVSRGRWNEKGAES